MDKRYQVFISSTYTDLREARAAVSEALLRANCFPAGMELFPAADAEQFDYIKEMIDQSDYYLILLAGRYGSISPETGLSYTEMEYDYAVETGKPIIRLVHRDPMKLAGEHLEQTDEGREGLKAFRTKLLAGRLVSMWDDTRELKVDTVFALQDIQRRHKAVGWVRGDTALDAAEALEVSRMRKRLAELEEAERARETSDDPWHWELPASEQLLASEEKERSVVKAVLARTLQNLPKFVKHRVSRSSFVRMLVEKCEVEEAKAVRLTDALIVDGILELDVSGFLRRTGKSDKFTAKVGLGEPQDDALVVRPFY